MSLETRNITLYCPICGNDQFSCIDESLEDLSNASGETRLQCSDCKSIITKDELINSNQDVINANIEDITQEAIKEFEKQLKKVFK